ncbi:MAG: hypothetical protein H6831_06565 [Planctomycetes bacterium]|nr:hypothetical protein [Planctomycetota bacterium]MCB9904052.1 hypothetical protein [Planctomycetota bacterium]
MAVPSVWFLNLDADHELARPAGYAPTAAVLARVDALRARVREDLFEDGDVELVPGVDLPAAARGLEGRAWCMTPRARKLLTAAGADPVASPALEVLRRVNSRSFAYALTDREEGSLCSDDPRVLQDYLRAASAGTQWLAKRAHGMAGRGQRRLAGGALSAADSQWLAKSCELGAVLVEPRRELELECVVHGEVGRDGTLRLAPVLQQLCDEFGAWLENVPDPPLDDVERAALSAAAAQAGRALAAAGYFGPFGLDSYAWREAGRRRWNPLSDLNARYTMGWSRHGLVPCP